MAGLLFALTEGERLGILGLVGICVTAGASVVGAVLSHRVRRENSDQHGESQRLLVTLADKVDGHGQKLDQVADRVESVAARVDHAHSRIDNHKRRWFR
jgi:uncharacterized protein YlxW (UPF0749 family)